MPRPTIEDLNRWMVVGFDRLYGLEFDACSDGEVSAHVRITEQHKQPMGIVHGGLYATIAESIATIAAVVSVAGDGNTAVGYRTAPASSVRSAKEAFVPSADAATAAARHRSGMSRSPTMMDARAPSPA